MESVRFLAVSTLFERVLAIGLLPCLLFEIAGASPNFLHPSNVPLAVRSVETVRFNALTLPSAFSTRLQRWLKVTISPLRMSAGEVTLQFSNGEGKNDALQTPLARGLWAKASPISWRKNIWTEAVFTAVLEWFPRAFFVGSAAWFALTRGQIDYFLLIPVNAAIGMFAFQELHRWAPPWSGAQIKAVPLGPQALPLLRRLLLLDIVAGGLVAFGWGLWAIPVVLWSIFFHARHDRYLFQQDRLDFSDGVDRSKIEKSVRQRKVDRAIGIGMASLLGTQFLFQQLYGISLLDQYLEIQRQGGWSAGFLSGMTAVILGMAARVAGMARSDTFARLSRPVLGLMLAMQIVMRFITGWLSAWIYGWIDAHDWGTLGRAVVSMGYGLAMSTLQDIPFTVWVSRADAYRMRREGLSEVASKLDQETTWLKQWGKNNDGIMARLSTSYLQQYIVQNLVSSEWRILITFSLGFLMNTFRSMVAFMRKPMFKPAKVFLWGATIAQIFFFLRDTTSGWFTVGLSSLSAMYFVWRNSSFGNGSSSSGPRSTAPASRTLLLAA